MAKLGRKAQYGDLCAVEGCTEPRHVLNSKGTSSRSRLCDRHYREDMAARYAARRAEQQAATPAPTGFAVADVYALWDGHGYSPELFYNGRRVLGIKPEAFGYTLVLVREDEAIWVLGEERLEVAP